MTNKDQLVIAGFGASTMRGWREGLLPSETFRAVLERGLQEHGIPAVVTDGGVGGNTTIDAMRRFDSDVLDLNPDVVLIGIGINDSAIPEGKTEPRVPPVAYRTNLQYWVDWLKGRDIPMVFLTLQAASKSREAAHNKRLEPYIAIQREIAEQEGIVLVDVFEHLLELEAKGLDLETLYMDGVHFNVEGNELIGEMLLDLEWDGQFFSRIWEKKRGASRD